MFDDDFLRRLHEQREQFERAFRSPVVEQLQNEWRQNEMRISRLFEPIAASAER